MSNPRPAASPARAYAIVGGGAIGGTLGWHLARAGHHVVIIDSDAEQVQAIREHGVTLVRDETRRSQAVGAACTTDEFDGRLHRVLLAVKAHATSGAAQWIADRLEPDGWVASMQNGLNEAVIAEHVGVSRTVGALVDLFADVVGPGLISDGGQGAVAVGELDGTMSERVLQLVEDLQAWGPAVATPNISGFLWSKVGLGAMLIATALCNDPMGVSVDRHRRAMHGLAGEVFTLTGELGLVLEPFDAFEPDAYRPASAAEERDAATNRLVRWLSGQRKNRTGVWRDIAVRHRATEVPTFYGPVLELADQRGVPVPILRDLLRQLAEVEADPASMSPARLDALDALATEVVR